MQNSSVILCNPTGPSSFFKFQKKNYAHILAIIYIMQELFLCSQYLKQGLT